MGADSANSGSLDELLRLLRDAPGDAGTQMEGVRRNAATGKDTAAWKRAVCLTSKETGELATGIMPDERAAILLEHVSGCEICSRELRQAKSDLARELSSEEESVLGNLQSSGVKWQAELVTAVRRGSVRRVWRQPIWPWMSAAAALVLLGAGWFWLMKQRGPERLLEEAYIQGRPFEYRLDLPGYSELKQQRGGSAVKSPALIKAEAQLVDLRQEGANDASSLRLIGIGDLLQGDAEAASGNLTRALAAAPPTDMASRAKLMTELAVAKALQGQEDAQPSEYGSALNYLAEVIHSDPQNAVAIFDSALIFEQLKQYGQASDYWTRYLKLDSSSRWSDIAKQHLSDIELKKNNAPPH